MTKRLPSQQMSRKARFRASLALARITAKDWCAEHAFTEGHLYQVLRGDRKSAATVAKIDAFIAKHLGDAAA